MRVRLGDASVSCRDRHADQPLDVAKIGPLLIVTEGDRYTLRASAGGATDAVDITFGDVRQIVVDDVANAVDVDTAGSNVSRNQRTQFAETESREHALALILRLVAVDCFGSMAGFLKAAHHLVGAMLRPGEDQYTIGFFGLEHLDQK